VPNVELVNRLIQLAYENFNLKELKEIMEYLSLLKRGITQIPRPDQTLFLYMPFNCSSELKNNREEKPDGHEISEEHLKNAEEAYLELSSMYNWTKINCSIKGKPLSIEKIHQKILKKCILTGEIK